MDLVLYCVTLVIGFKLQFISASEDTNATACSHIEGLFTEHACNFKKCDAFATNVSYEFTPSPTLKLSKLFQSIEEHKKEWGIVDWGLSQTTLEEVFIKIVTEEDAQAD